MSINNAGYHSDDTDFENHHWTEMLQPIKHSETTKVFKSFSNREIEVEDKKKLIKKWTKRSISNAHPKEQEKEEDYPEEEKLQHPVVRWLFNPMPGKSEIAWRLKTKPYRKAIERLRMIREEDSPMKKLRLLDDVNDLILESIDDFWKQVPVDKSKLIIAAEEKISIYIYIVIKAKLIDFYSNIWFIWEFITEDVRINSLGN